MYPPPPLQNSETSYIKLHWYTMFYNHFILLIGLKTLGLLIEFWLVGSKLSALKFFYYKFNLQRG